MVAFIFTFFLSITGFSSTEQSVYPAMDSVKRPLRNPNSVIPDSTARFVRINRIFITGNRVTHDRIILRELTLKPGDVIYSTNLDGIIELDKRKLINTRLFNTVTIRVLELDKNSWDMVVDLKERWYTFPSPIFDLADRNFNEWWQNYNHDFRRVNYGLRLYRLNMRGRNETMRFIAQFGYQRRFELYYRIPNLDKEQKHGLALDFDYSEAKNVAFRTNDHKLEFLETDFILRSTRGGGVTYFFRNSFFETHSLKFDYRDNLVSDTLLLRNPNYFGGEGKRQQIFSSLGYNFTSDHRDYAAYPLHGYHFSGNILKTGLTKSDDVNKIEVTASYTRFFDLKKYFYLSNYTLGYLSSPDDLPYFNLGALGFRRQFVRGYEVYLIEGPAYIMNKTTFKKRILSRTYNWSAMPLEQFQHIPLSIYFKVYADVGYVQNYKNYEIGSRLTNKLLSGIGAGIDIIGSYDAVFRFEYTFNIEGQNGLFFHLRKEF